MTHELKNIAPKFLTSHSTFDTGFHNALSPNQFFERFHTFFSLRSKGQNTIVAAQTNALHIKLFSNKFLFVQHLISIRILDSIKVYCLHVRIE